MDPDEHERGEMTDLAIRVMIQEMVQQALHRGAGHPFVMTFVLMNPGDKGPGGRTGDYPSGHHPIEVFRLGGVVILQIGLPGAEPGGIRISFGNISVRITARCGNMMVRSTALVPPPELGTITVSFRNGILDITYQERNSRPENPQGTPVDT